MQVALPYILQEKIETAPGEAAFNGRIILNPAPQQNGGMPIPINYGNQIVLPVTDAAEFAALPASGSTVQVTVTVA